MANLAVLAMLAGFIWGTAGILGYPGISWKPGAIILVASAAWLVSHEAMPPEPLVEAVAIIIFIALSVAHGRLYPPKRAEKPKEPDAK